jgi:hypothetical protein
MRHARSQSVGLRLIQRNSSTKSKKKNSAKKPDRHEGHGNRDHLAVYPVCGAWYLKPWHPAAQSCAGLQWLWRTASTSAASAKVPPCSRAMYGHQAQFAGEPTQLWPSVMKL